MTLQDIQTWLQPFDGRYGWIIQIFVVIFTALLTSYLVGRVLARLQRRLQQTDNPWDDAMLDAARKPLTALIWLLGITLAGQIVYRETDAAIFEVIPSIRAVGVISLLAWFLIRLQTRIEANIIAGHTATDSAFDRTSVEAIGKLLRISVFITAGLVILQTLGFSITGVLTFGGIGGIAVGFAAKDLLANFFGGLMIYLDRPIAVGDWIRSPDREIEGTVEAIGWRLTRIRTFDKRPLYIPNATFTTIAVENPSRMTNRRIKETIGVRYDDAAKVRDIVRDVKDMLKNHPEIDQNQTLIVNFDKFAASSLDFFIYTFTKTTNWIHYHEVKEDVLLKALDIITAHGAEVAFPTSTLHVPDGVEVRGDPAHP